jgi:hypothetical protein
MFDYPLNNFCIYNLMKDKKNKKDEQQKEKIIPFKPAKLEKNILEPFSELLATKGKKLSFNSKPKTPRVCSNTKLTPFNITSAIQKNLIRRYSTTNADYNDNVIDNLIYNKNCHMVSVFKDYMIIDYIDEFLKRIYKSNESVDRIPKIANYYKNYLKFFCNPIFRDFKVNGIIQSYGDFKAEIYYNNNYGGKKKDKDKLLDEGIRNIFNTTVKENIDRNSLTQTTIQADNTIFESEMNYKPILNNFGIRDYYADGMNMIEFEDSHSTLDHLLTVKSKEESILHLISSLENNNKHYIDKENEKVFKKFENKVIGKDSKLSIEKESKKVNTNRAKSEKNVVDTTRVKSPDSQVYEFNHIKHPSLNRPPSSLKLHIGEFKNIKLSKTNNLWNNNKPGHTKNSSSQPSNDLLQTNTSNKHTFTTTFHNNTPVLNKDLKYSNKLYQGNESTRLKNRPESRLTAHQQSSMKMNIKNETKTEKRNSTSELQGKQFAIPNNIGSINDIMKITLSLCVDKSSRNRPLSNQMLAANTTNGINNLNLGNKGATIINNVDSINNFNININNQINLPDNIHPSLLSTLPIQISTKNTPNGKEPLNNLFLERNKLSSRTRNKESNIYKMPSNTIRTSNLEGGEKNGFLRESKDMFTDGKLFSSYNTGICNLTA